MARAERAQAWLADQLGASFAFDLFVLDENDWAEHALVTAYAVPHADPDTGKIVLGAAPGTLFDALCTQFWPDFSEGSRAAIREVYGDPPTLAALADLLLVHELTHLVPRGRPLPTLWHEELFANLGAVGYLASEEPDELPVHMTFCRASLDVPATRVAYSAPEDMDKSYQGGGFANYAWYQVRLTVAAERLWNTHGVDALRALQAGNVDVAAEVERAVRHPAGP